MSKMTDSKYFTTTKKGEIFELKAELNSDRKEKKKEAVKKVIASMTVGKDVRWEWDLFGFGRMKFSSKSEIHI